MKTLTDTIFTTKQAISILLIMLILGCSSTPQHTNVMIFGTNTKIALDVSQDATSGVGVTLGYKRQEAVWMPLLPNQGSQNIDQPLQPSTCNKPNECPKFEGVDSANQRDTYSVLASFGSKLDGVVDSDGKKVQGNGEIAQYFATGLAARLLARNGGAGLVSTNVHSALTIAEQNAITKEFETEEKELNELIAELTDASDPNKLDSKRREEALAKSPGKEISEKRKAQIIDAKTTSELRAIITAFPHKSVAKPMLDTLNAK